MRRVVVYGRPGCHLCDVAWDVIQGVRRSMPATAAAAFDVAKVDVSGDAALEGAYGRDVPVVAIDGVVAFTHAVDAAGLASYLAAAAAPPAPGAA